MDLNIVPQEFTSKNSFSQRLGLGSLQIKIASTFKQNYFKVTRSIQIWGHRNARLDIWDSNVIVWILL